MEYIGYLVESCMGSGIESFEFKSKPPNSTIFWMACPV